MSSATTGHPLNDEALTAETAVAARSATTRSPRGRRSWRAVVAALIPIGMLVALSAWGFSSAVGSSPDDDYHMATIWCAQGLREGLCEAGSADDRRVLPRRLIRANCYPFDPEISARCPIANPDGFIDTARGDFLGRDYPPVFYAVMGMFAQQDIPASVLTMRILNAAIFVGMMTAIYLLHRRHRGVVLWSALATLVPFGMFIIPSLNPSSWAVTSAASLWLAVAGFYEASTRGRMIGFGVLAILAAIIGAGARADVAIFGAMAAVAVAIAKFRRANRYWLRSLLVAAICVLCAAFFLSSGQQGAVSAASPRSLNWAETISFATKTFLQLPWMWGSNFGQTGLGWVDTVMPAIVWMTALGIAASLTFHGLRRSPWRKSVAVGLVGLALVLVPLYMIVKDQVSVGQGVQPRYIFPILVLFVGLCLWGLRGRGIELSGAQLVVIAGGLTIANTVALHTNIRRYVAGLDVIGLNLNARLEWWWHVPFGPNSLFIVGAFGFLVAVVGAAVTSWPSWATPRTAGHPRHPAAYQVTPISDRTTAA